MPYNRNNNPGHLYFKICLNFKAMKKFDARRKEALINKILSDASRKIRGKVSRDEYIKQVKKIVEDRLNKGFAMDRMTSDQLKVRLKNSDNNSSVEGPISWDIPRKIYNNPVEDDSLQVTIEWDLPAEFDENQAEDDSVQGPISWDVPRK